MILAARDLADFAKVAFHNVGNRFIVFVDGFAGLEIDIRVLRRAADDRIVRIQRALAEFADRVPIDEFFVVFVVEDFDFLDFMGRTEAVEEIQERDPRLDGRHVGHAGQVHDFLYAARSEQGEPGLPGSHDVLMVAENVQRARRQGAGRYIEDARQQFAGNLIHIGNHEQQSLGRRIGRREGAGFEGAVHRAGRAGFGLHFYQFDGLPKQVLFPLGGPLVHMLRHGRRRRNRINTGNIDEGVRRIGSSFVAVHGFHYGHGSTLLSHSKPTPCAADGVSVRSVPHWLDGFIIS